MKKRLTVPGSLKEYDALCFGRLVKALYTYVTQVSDDDAFKTLFSELKKWTETIFSDKPASDLVMTKTNIYMYRLLSMITGNEDDGPIPVGEIAQLLRESKFETAVQWRDAQKRMIASALSMDWESVARKNRHFFDSPTKLEAFNIKLLRCFHRVILTGLTFKGPKAILKLCEVTEGNPSIDSVLLKSVISYLERITIDRQTAAYFSDEKDKLVEVVKKRIERMKGVQKSNPTDIALLEERLRNVDDPARIPIWDEIEARRTLQIRTHQALMFQGGLGDEAKAMLRYDYEALYNRLSLLALSRVLSQRMYYYFVPQRCGDARDFFAPPMQPQYFENYERAELFALIRLTGQMASHVPEVDFAARSDLQEVGENYQFAVISICCSQLRTEAECKEILSDLMERVSLRTNPRFIQGLVTELSHESECNMTVLKYGYPEIYANIMRDRL